MEQSHVHSNYQKNLDSLNAEILRELKEQKLLIINPQRKNGLIIYKRYHAEFAGPGAMIGSVIDLDAVKVLSTGRLSLVQPDNSEQRISAYLIRRQWIRLLKQIADNPIPLQRAQVILNQFEHWFDLETTAQLPNEAFAMLVGVLPQTIKKARNKVDRLEL